MFPFGRDSNGARSIIEYLSTNHNYKTRITDDGKFHVHQKYLSWLESTLVFRCSDLQNSRRSNETRRSSGQM